ncbi:MAG: hypothetical protein M3Y55_10985 [Pseudomonadota bacterium]|nr:hypothetical protein [Pseudomonadota bacterium]
MSKRLDVLKRLKLLIAAAVPEAELLGLSSEEAEPARLQAGGRIIVWSGDPCEPEIDLSPLAYNWSHRIPIEVATSERLNLTSEEALDDVLMRIGAAIVGDRHLGGLCDWLDVTAPATEDLWVEGAEAPRGTELMITATYVTASPLS